LLLDAHLKALSPDPMTHVLLVAPDSDLRKSVEFALQAEGYDVTSCASIGARERPRYDCTIVDHHALGNNQRFAADFCRIFRPVILLANLVPHPLSPFAYRTVMKPLLGAALTDAIHDAIGHRAATT
jgi:hypothetical protein